MKEQLIYRFIFNLGVLCKNSNFTVTKEIVEQTLDTIEVQIKDTKVLEGHIDKYISPYIAEFHINSLDERKLEKVIITFETSLHIPENVKVYLLVNEENKVLTYERF